MARGRVAATRPESGWTVLPSDGSIASSIIHDVRGRFAALQPYVELLEEESIGPLNERQRDCVAVVARNLGRLLDGVVGLLELLREDLDRLPLDAREVSVGELLSTAATLLQARGIEAITVELEGGLPRVVADAARVGRMGVAFSARTAATGRAATTLRAATCPTRPERVCLLLDLPECPQACGSAGEPGEDLPDDVTLTLAAWLLRRQGGRLWATPDGQGICLALPAVPTPLEGGEE
jgi:hypothetical protein